MTVAERIKIIADQEGISISQFERTIGASNGVISRAIKNGTDIQSKWVTSTLDNYRKYSAEWLLTGEGEMLKEKTPEREKYERTQLAETVAIPLYNSRSSERVVDEQMVPLYSIEATAGVIETLDMSPEYVQGNILIPGMPICDGALHVSGYSMKPLLENGDIIAFKTLHDISNIHYGDMYILTLNEDGDIYTSVKWVHAVEGDTDRVLLVSENDHYPPRQALKADITWIARVKVCIRFLAIS